MLIKIDSSVVNNEDQSLWVDETVEALEILAIARREGKHSIIGDRKTLKKISECTRLSERARQTYNKLYEKSAQFRQFQSAVTRYIEVVNSCYEPQLDLNTCPGKEIIKVSPRFFSDSSLAQKTILLCENNFDANLYEKIANVYLVWKKIKVVIACDGRGGGGNTITDQFINIQKTKKNICLCIVDSDRIAPNGKLGTTAKRINSEHNENCIITKILILDLHEIENLIPNSILSELCLENVERQESLKILTAIQGSSAKDVRGFLDIKNGTMLNKIVNISNPVEKEYWKARLSEIPGVSTRIDSWCHTNWHCSITEKCSTTEKCNCRISLGFGERILEQVVNYLDKKNPPEIAKIVDEEVRLEWEKVGQVILNWCIAESPIRA